MEAIGASSMAAQAGAGLKPLFRMALIKGSVPSVLLHIRRGANLRERDERGFTPLMLAASAGKHEICLLLLAEGADASDTTPDGRTAADLATAAGHTALGNALMPRRAIASFRTGEGATLEDPEGEINVSDWEAEAESQVGAGDSQIRLDALSIQTSLSLVRPNAGSDWSDIETTLPDRPRSRSRVSAALRRWLGQAAVGVVRAREVRRAGRRLPGLAHLLEDLGVRTEEDLFDRALARRPLGRRDPAVAPARFEDALELLEALLDPCDSELVRRAEIDSLEPLDRGGEQSMFRSLGEARHAVFRILFSYAGELYRPTMAATESDETDPDDAVGDEGTFSAALEVLLELGEAVAIERLSELDLDVGAAHEVAARLESRGDSAGGRLRLQLMRYLKARDRVVSAGLRWVEPCARWYLRPGVDLGDLCQLGAIGLMRAAERFDPTRGYRFQTFASWWIRQACSRGLADESRTIRLPIHVQEARARLRRARLALKAEGTERPELADLADRAGIPVEKARRLRVLPSSVSLDESRTGVWVARLPGSDAEAAFGAVLENDRRRHLLRLLNDLPEREAEVLRLRFGIGGYEEHTLEEVGRLYGVSRERIRQLEHKALGRLGRGPHRHLLRTLL